MVQLSTTSRLICWTALVIWKRTHISRRVRNGRRSVNIINFWISSSKQQTESQLVTTGRALDCTRIVRQQPIHMEQKYRAAFLYPVYGSGRSLSRSQLWLQLPPSREKLTSLKTRVGGKKKKKKGFFRDCISTTIVSKLLRGRDSAFTRTLSLSLVHRSQGPAPPS